MAVWDLPENERAAAFNRYSGPSGFDFLKNTPNAIVGVTACLSQMRQSLENARFNRWPVAFYPLDLVDGEIFKVKEWEGLLFVAEKTLITCERIYNNMVAPGRHIVNWEERREPEARLGRSTYMVYDAVAMAGTALQRRNPVDQMGCFTSRTLPICDTMIPGISPVQKGFRGGLHVWG
jgi:hypothetical protein